MALDGKCEKKKKTWTENENQSSTPADKCQRDKSGSFEALSMAEDIGPNIQLIPTKLQKLDNL